MSDYDELHGIADPKITIDYRLPAISPGRLPAPELSPEWAARGETPPLPARPPVRSMRRYEVSIDGIPCRIGLTGDPVAFGALGYSAGIEFWAEHDEAAEPEVRTFTIVGTGHPVPPGAVYAGTAPRTPDGLVWHLFEITGSEAVQ